MCYYIDFLEEIIQKDKNYPLKENIINYMNELKSEELKTIRSIKRAIRNFW